jgi:cytochrome c
MKRSIYLLVFSFCIISCTKKENQSKSEPTKISGEAIFNENNCMACHKIDQKVVGPSLQDIAKIYKAQNGNLVAFLKEEADPIVDETMYETMKINLQVTKTLSDDELKALENYILSQSK